MNVITFCGEACPALGVYCLVQITRDDNTHLGDHRAWSTADEDEPWLLRWPNNVRNVNVWRKVNCHS